MATQSPEASKRIYTLTEAIALVASGAQERQARLDRALAKLDSDIEAYQRAVDRAYGTGSDVLRSSTKQGAA